MPGVPYNDLKLAARVRTKALKLIEAVLDDAEHIKHTKQYQEQVLLKLAGTVLPRLNEHTGEGGTPLFLPTEILQKNGIKYAASLKPKESSEGSPPV